MAKRDTSWTMAKYKRFLSENRGYKRQYFFVQKCKYFHVQLIIFLADLG